MACSSSRWEQAPPERVGSAEVRFLPYEADLEAAVRCYQAADAYAHAARADTFHKTVLEALACGTPGRSHGSGRHP